VWEGVAHPPAAIPLDREAGMSPLVLRTKAVPAIQPAHEHQRVGGRGTLEHLPQPRTTR
jgi:hypothetical protein